MLVKDAPTVYRHQKWSYIMIFSAFLKIVVSAEKRFNNQREKMQ